MSVLPDYWPTYVQATATIIGACFALLGIAIQLALHSRFIVKQAHTAETTKLRLDIYRHVVESVNANIVKEVELSTFLRKFVVQVDASTHLTEMGLPVQPPSSRFAKLSELVNDFRLNAVTFISFVENWQVIDARLYVFQTAFSSAIHDFAEAHSSYVESCVSMFPVESPSDEGTVYPWLPLTPPQRALLEEKTQAVLATLMTWGSFVHDFRVETQNSLLGKILSTKCPARLPLDPNNVVIQLENHAFLQSYFERSTAWGETKQRAETTARDEIARRAKPTL